MEMQQQEMERDRLYMARETHVEALTRFFKELEDREHFRELDADDLIIREKRLQFHFGNMERAHRRYCRVCVLASNDIYNTMETEVMTTVARIRRRIRELEGNQGNGGAVGRPEGNVGRTPSTPFQQLLPMIRVETTRPPQIGKFNGSPADWPAFRDLFIAEVDNKDLEPVTKLRYLQEACVGRAAERLGPWQPTNENYRHAWGEMMDAYNDDYHVVHDILGKLFGVRRQEEEDHTSLCTLVDALTVSQRQIQTICPQATTVADQFWIHVVKQRLPKSTLDAWERYRNSKGTTSLPTSADLRQFLVTRAKGRREREYEGQAAIGATRFKAGASSSRYRPYELGHARAKLYGDQVRPSHERPRVSNTKDEWYQSKEGRTRRAFPPNKCVVPLCQLSHVVWKCNMFPQLPLTERRDLVRTHRLCSICLNAGHLSFTCPRREMACGRCPESKFRHHVKLCPKLAEEGGRVPERRVERTEGVSG